MSFEEQLLMDLKAEFTAREDRRRRGGRRLFLGLAVTGAAAVTALAVPLLTGAQSAAYAVTEKSDGTVGVEIREFEEADRLERDLRAAGVKADVTYLGPGKRCERDRGVSKLLPDGAVHMRKGGLDIDPRLIDENHTLVLEFAERGGEDPGVVWTLATMMIPGEPGPCVVVDDPDWDDLGGPEGQPPAGS
ncbi:MULTISPECIES: hypothetical protein [Nonomuraea]|uniref:Uncharacterized protein n=1 Tax=Nonomuraea ferruginea TaxID=46174 RepID=A0ABT4SR37_9ACTN|nr:hypothetical protein [Nonomuraea ferruginea]MDA0639699.1 hypothetical protein [Nonomuraea ferruginea]